jgi:hypothetical protein
MPENTTPPQKKKILKLIVISINRATISMKTTSRMVLNPAGVWSKQRFASKTFGLNSY